MAVVGRRCRELESSYRAKEGKAAVPSKEKANECSVTESSSLGSQVSGLSLRSQAGQTAFAPQSRHSGSGGHWEHREVTLSSEGARRGRGGWHTQGRIEDNMYSRAQSLLINQRTWGLLGRTVLLDSLQAVLH